jgi:enolase
LHDFDIVDIVAWEALDSRGNPTVACEVRLRAGPVGVAIAPSGASTGAHEVHELRDGDDRYDGRGVRRAVESVETLLLDAVRGVDATDQAEVDRRLIESDGTPELGRAGGNAVLAVSVATAQAAAAGKGRPGYEAWADPSDRPLLPRPMVNVISGGAHAGGVIDIQDVLVVPVGATTFAEALEWCARVRRRTADAAADRGANPALVADEGGIGLPLRSNQEALDLICEGFERAGLEPGREVGVALDVAASQFYGEDGRYRLRAEERSLSASEWSAELAEWCRSYPIVSVEDALAEDDWETWPVVTRLLSGCQIVGDDLFVTDVGRLRRGIEVGAANAVLVKPNQIGTLTAAKEVVRAAQSAGYATVLSARSGETEDSWLADLAVAWRTGQIKVGSTTRSERTAKWNRLLRIEAALSDGEPYQLAPWPSRA